MLVFLVLLAFMAESLCQDVIIENPRFRPCRENEVYMRCRTICQPQFCNISYTTITCPEFQRCEPGCDCIKDYLRDDYGICVPAEKCPPKTQCGENQMPSDCADDYSDVPTIQVCRSGCRCIKGYSRDSYNRCVPTPAHVECGENEEFSTCRQTCPPQTCDWDPTTTACKPGPCQPGCNCKEGYLRDVNGNCIPKEKCPPIECTGKYEFLNPCPSACFGDACGELDEETATCNTLVAVECRPRCMCQRGYQRDGSGNCIPKAECHRYKPYPCSENEVYMKCRTTCPPQFCNLSSTDYRCDKILRCEPGCDCIKDYLRDYNGICVRSDECPAPCGENQVPSDCADDYCDVPTAQVCRPGCSCVEGYTRNSYNQCVPIPPLLPCGKNEEPTVCRQTCPPQTCDWDPNLYACKPGPCQPGCNCKKGYLRDQKEKCILQEKCPPILPQCGENEEPTDCAKNIRPGDSTLTIKCNPCQCIKNYVRDSKAKANVFQIHNLSVERTKYQMNAVYTQPQCGKNEVPNECSIVYLQPILPLGPSTDLAAVESIEAERIRCRPCRCADGYVRDANDVCVPKPVCGENEVSTNCKQTCPPQDCTWDPTRMDCRPLECKPGCNCIEGHLRDENGKCIPREQCPECNGDPNAVYSQCPNQCVSTCKCPNAICSQECGEPFGCKCRLGYIRSEEGRCILPTECPGGNPCGRNETFAPCLIGCPTNNCPRDDSLAVPQCLPPFPCPGGCACKSNYKRISSENRRCILVTDCPPFKCRGNNTVYNSCPSACFSDQCGTLQMEPTTCNTLVPNVCRPRCVCREDHRRNSSGDCIPIKQCPPVKCPKNEYLNPCPSACFGDGCGELDEETAPCNTLVEHVCRPRCMCRKGYQRDGSGNCIPKAKCPVPS
nr:zonadhesin-like [Maniola hyperantus]